MYWETISFSTSLRSSIALRRSGMFKIPFVLAIIKIWSMLFPTRRISQISLWRSAGGFSRIATPWIAFLQNCSREIKLFPLAYSVLQVHPEKSGFWFHGFFSSCSSLLSGGVSGVSTPGQAGLCPHNPLLAKTMPFSLQASRSFTAPVFPRCYCRLVREIASLLPGRGIFILVCSFSCQGAVTAPQIIPVASFLFGSLLWEIAVL